MFRDEREERAKERVEEGERVSFCNETDWIEIWKRHSEFVIAWNGKAIKIFKTWGRAKKFLFDKIIFNEMEEE